MAERNYKNLLDTLRRSSYVSVLAPTDQDDVLQATLEVVVRKYAHLQDPDLSRVAFTIAKLLCLSKVRSKIRLHTQPITKELPTSDVGPTEHLEREEERELLARVRAALHEALQSALTRKQHEAILRRFYQNQKLREIADEMDVSVSTAHDLIASALIILHAQLAEYRELWPALNR